MSAEIKKCANCGHSELLHDDELYECWEGEDNFGPICACPRFEPSMEATDER